MSENETTRLMEQARQQLDEHVAWLVAEIEKIPADVGMAGGKAFLCHQAYLIKLRVVTANNNRVSVVWDYPDELITFLQAESTPVHLRDTLKGGHFVNTEQPAFKAERVP
jgi:hypothetical protein